MVGKDGMTVPVTLKIKKGHLRGGKGGEKLKIVDLQDGFHTSVVH